MILHLGLDLGPTIGQLSSLDRLSSDGSGVAGDHDAEETKTVVQHKAPYFA